MIACTLAALIVAARSGAVIQPSDIAPQNPAVENLRSDFRQVMERVKGIEPSTYSLGSCRSTSELHPHVFFRSPNGPLRQACAEAIALGRPEDAEEEAVVPAGSLDLAAGGALVGALAEEIEGEAT